MQRAYARVPGCEHWAGTHALRHTADAWEKLHGEVAFDELLVANVLRFDAPEAFNFLLRRVDTLRSSRARDARERAPFKPRESLAQRRHRPRHHDRRGASTGRLRCRSDRLERRGDHALLGERALLD